MKFMLTFSWKPDTKCRDEGIARFRKTGGQPPNGVTLLGRWTRADFNGGFDLLETDDEKIAVSGGNWRLRPAAIMASNAEPHNDADESSSPIRSRCFVEPI
jgi:Protein of unknown function (DUF3303)